MGHHTTWTDIQVSACTDKRREWKGKKSVEQRIVECVGDVLRTACRYAVV